MPDDGAILEIEYELDADFVRRAWFDQFRKGLPSVLAFWGTIIFIGLLAMIYYRQSAREFVFFSLVVGIVVAVLSYIYYSSYSQSMRETRELNSVAGKNVRLVFKSDADGFDYINGKNFSHIAWDSVSFYEESGEFIILGYSGGFYIPKSAFRSDAEISFLKSLVQIKSLAPRGK
ncbi:MAG TPA: YcxB family protein [Pyrinomonadaceae bacterium]